MSDRLEILLHNRAQAWAVIQSVLFPRLKEVLQGGSVWVLTLTRRKRTPRQNRRYWGNGVLSQIAQQATVNGRMFDAEVWHEMFKRMFVGVIELPNGDIQGKSSTDLGTTEFAEFCTKVEAYACTDLGVTFYDLAPREVEQPKPARKVAAPEVGHA
ncbi:MAG: hypothetical protein KGL90_15540 [Burkholderiales bacterium]|nr:hypothetical protein [Burkholderiales bacterium]